MLFTGGGGEEMTLFKYQNSQEVGSQRFYLLYHAVGDI